MDERETITAYVDAECDLCVGAERVLRRIDPDLPLVTAPIAAAPADRDAMLAELHVVASDGSVVRGYDAVVALVGASRRLRGLGWVLGLRPLRVVGRPVYRMVARHRPRRSA